MDVARVHDNLPATGTLWREDPTVNELTASHGFKALRQSVKRSQKQGFSDLCTECKKGFIRAGGCDALRADSHGEAVNPDEFVPPGCDSCSSETGLMQSIFRDCDIPEPTPPHPLTYGGASALDGISTLPVDFCLHDCINEFGANGGCGALLDAISGKSVDSSKYIPNGCLECSAVAGMEQAVLSFCNISLPPGRTDGPPAGYGGPSGYSTGYGAKPVPIGFGVVYGLGGYKEVDKATINSVLSEAGLPQFKGQASRVHTRDGAPLGASGTDFPTISTDFCMSDCINEFGANGGCGALLDAISGKAVDSSKYIPDGCMACSSVPGMEQAVLSFCNIAIPGETVGPPAGYGAPSGYSTGSGAKPVPIGFGLVYELGGYKEVDKATINAVLADAGMPQFKSHDAFFSFRAKGGKRKRSKKQKKDTPAPVDTVTTAAPPITDPAPSIGDFCSNCVDGFKANGGCSALSAAISGQDVNPEKYIPDGCSKGCEDASGMQKAIQDKCEINLSALVSQHCSTCAAEFMANGGCNLIKAALAGEDVDATAAAIPSGCDDCANSGPMAIKIVSECGIDADSLAEMSPSADGGHAGPPPANATEFCMSCKDKFVAKGGCDALKAAMVGEPEDPSEFVPPGCEDCDKLPGVMEAVYESCGVEEPELSAGFQAPITSFCGTCAFDFIGAGGCRAIVQALQGTDVDPSALVSDSCKPCGSEEGIIDVIMTKCNIPQDMTDVVQNHVMPKYGEAAKEDDKETAAEAISCVDSWMGDGECDEINDTESCHHDGGDCVAKSA